MTPTPKPGTEDAAWIEFLRQREHWFRRPMTVDEVAAARRGFDWLCAHAPLRILNLRLTTRQGEIMPDFEALYAQKDEIDRKFKRDG